MESDGGSRWYHNPQVPIFMWNWDPSGYIDYKLIERWIYDLGIEGSIQVLLE